MCGIIGGWFRSGTTHEPLDTGLRSLGHRGPDDQGETQSATGAGNVVLGHTRLSIIDLSAAGHQPMWTRDRRFAISYNGEVYNYPELRRELAALGREFDSDSDTEVLLQAWAEWGEACVPRLKGMFAFAVFDVERGLLTCVRDAFGIKPLMFSVSHDYFTFSSELRALRDLTPVAPTIDLQRAYDYLVNGKYDDSERSFLEGILHLEPAHILEFDTRAGRIRRNARWWWPDVSVREDLTFNDAVDAVRDMFLDNVRLHLRSDVSLGAALSGGVDSSAFVCAMRRIEPDMDIRTFSFIAAGSAVDEERWVDLVNGHVNACAHKVRIDAADLAADMDDMIRAQGEPFGSTSIYAQYRVFRLAKEHGVTVTLDGQGADELLAGYHGFPGQRIQSLVECGRGLDALQFGRQWARWPGRSPRAAAMAYADEVIPDRLRGFGRGLTGRHPSPRWLHTDMLEHAGVMIGPPRRLEGSDVRGRRVAAALRGALTQRGLPALLRHGDRNSMRWSIESRVPFLTTDFAEFVLRLPEHYLISDGGETKHVFRAAMRGIVPDAVLDRRDKIGFATPERDWLRVLAPRIGEWLDAADTVPFLKAREARQAIDSIIEGREPFSFRAWRLVNYCRWVQVAAL